MDRDWLRMEIVTCVFDVYRAQSAVRVRDDSDCQMLCNFSSLVNLGHPNISYNKNYIYIMDDSQNWVDELQYSTSVVCLPLLGSPGKKTSKNIHPDTFGSYWMCSR